MNKNEIIRTLQNNSDKIQRFGVKKIGLFGSYVKDVQTESSDLDFIVEFERGEKSFDTLAELKFFLEDLFDKEIDLVTIDSIRPELKTNIMENVEY